MKNLSRTRTWLKLLLGLSLGSLLAGFSGGGYISGETKELAQAPRRVMVYIDETEVAIPSNLGSTYISQESRTMVPLRFVSEKLGHKVEWDAKSKTVLIDGDSSLTRGMETQIVGERTYVPIRFISESLGYEVLYGRDDSVNAVFIYKDIKPSEAILRAYINNVVDLTTWNFVKGTGVVDNVKEGGRWKTILGEQTHKNPGYIIEDDELGLKRDFRIEKVSGKWPNEDKLPAPVFYVRGSGNGINVYFPSMDVYGTQVKRVMVKIHHRDEQKVYDQGYIGPSYSAIREGRSNLSDLMPNEPVWAMMDRSSPNAAIYRRNGAVYSTIWTKDKKPIPWPKDNRFKTLVELKITDKNMKDHTVLYHMDFNMVQ